MVIHAVQLTDIAGVVLYIHSKKGIAIIIILTRGLVEFRKRVITAKSPEHVGMCLEEVHQKK